MTYGYSINGEKKPLTEEEKRKLLSALMSRFGYEIQEKKKASA